jgi:hypothetical protein
MSESLCGSAAAAGVAEARAVGDTGKAAIIAHVTAYLG